MDFLANDDKLIIAYLGYFISVAIIMKIWEIV